MHLRAPRLAPLLTTLLATLVTAFATALAGVLPASAPAAAADTPAPSPAYAPLDRPGPALAVPAAELDAALSCHGDPASGPEPVLLNPATGVTPEQNYSWNYARAFTAQHRYWCWVTMPDHTLQDIQRSGEFLVHAIRTMHAATGRRIAVMGHSQGGMSMRWALRFWPDTRAMVDDVIGMAGSNHGTTALPCGGLRPECPPADWQQGSKAKFIEALNSGAETFAGISYTEVYSRTDEVVTPNSTAAGSSSSLRTGDGMISNVATQQICPLDAYEHLTVGTIDPVTYALVRDALEHPGPANPARISRSVCLQAFQPYADVANIRTGLEVLSAAPGLLTVSLPVNLVGAEMVPAEPPLRCYVFADGCASTPAAG
jgi:hypothetical protein